MTVCICKVYLGRDEPERYVLCNVATITSEPTIVQWQIRQSIHYMIACNTLNMIVTKWRLTALNLANSLQLSYKLSPKFITYLIGFYRMEVEKRTLAAKTVKRRTRKRTKMRLMTRLSRTVTTVTRKVSKLTTCQMRAQTAKKNLLLELTSRELIRYCT